MNIFSNICMFSSLNGDMCLLIQFISLNWGIYLEHPLNLSKTLFWVPKKNMFFGGDNLCFSWFWVLQVYTSFLLVILFDHTKESFKKDLFLFLRLLQQNSGCCVFLQVLPRAKTHETFLIHFFQIQELDGCGHLSTYHWAHWSCRLDLFADML